MSKRHKVWLAFSVLAFAVATSAQAQSAAGEQETRFHRVEEVIDGKCKSGCGESGTCNSADRSISQEEIECFLAAEVREVLAVCDHLQVADVEEYVERQATRKILNMSGVDSDGNGAIEENGLAVLEAARLEPPLTDVKSLLDGTFAPCPAAGASGVPPAPATAQVPAQPSRSWLDRLDTVVSIRQSFLDTRVIGNPATIGWSRFGSDDEILGAGRERSKHEIRAAIAIEPPRFFSQRQFSQWSLAYNPVLVVEADISSEPLDERDLITHRVGYQATWARHNIDKLLTGHNLDVTFDYLTDRDYQAEVLGSTFQYTPNLPRLGVGSPLGPEGLELRWRPYAGLLYRDVQDRGQSPQLENLTTFTDAYARVAAELTIAKQLKITPEVTFFQEFENEEETHIHRLFSARWIFDEQERVSIVLSHERGETSPAYKKRNLTKLALGLKLL